MAQEPRCQTVGDDTFFTGSPGKGTTTPGNYPVEGTEKATGGEKTPGLIPLQDYPLHTTF